VFRPGLPFASVQTRLPQPQTRARSASGLATRGLSPTITNNSNKSYSHFRATEICPFLSTLHSSYIARCFSSSFANIPGMLLLGYCVALPVNYLSSRETQIVVLLMRISAWGKKSTEARLASTDGDWQTSVVSCWDISGIGREECARAVRWSNHFPPPQVWLSFLLTRSLSLVNVT
jgi:hypothetical protein